MFFELLVQYKDKGYMRAKQACILAYWATRAGAIGDAKLLAYPPGRQSGKYSTHYDTVLASSPSAELFYSVDVPTLLRTDASTETHSLPTVPPHCALQEEMQQMNTAGLAQAVRENRFGRVYEDDPVVMAAAPGEIVLPFAIYIDGVSFQTRDSIVGFWVQNLFTNVRHLVAVLRLSEMCGCGCRGWCSIYPILLMLTWSLTWLRRGIWPPHREGERSWRESCDGPWQALAGQPLGFKAVCSYIKCDLKELCTSLGFASTATIRHPCACCLCNRETWDDMTGLSALGHEWGEHTVQVHHEAASSCEIECVLTRAAYSTVRACLEDDVRPKGNRGRCLIKGLPALGLSKGDRLERSPALPDTTAFDTLRPAAGSSVEVTFWRRSCETRIRHRCPLFSEATGLSPHKSLAIDWLHCLSLGLFLYYINAFVHAMIDSCAFGARGTFAERRLHVLRMMRARMATWRSAEEKSGRARTLPGHFTEGMLGEKGQASSLQGAESNAVLTFWWTAFSLSRPKTSQENIGHPWPRPASNC